MKKVIMMAALVLLTSATMQGQLKREYSKTTTASPVFSTTASPDIPTSVTFAGEKISFDRLDMAERLDRELTGIIYGQTTTELCFKRANRYFPALARILKEQGVPLDFLYLAVTESSMDYNAYSSAKAAGMWQLLAGTARDYDLEVTDDVDERYDPEKSTVAACKYLKAAFKKYGHWPTVAASYNAGMGRISGELTKQKVENSFDLYLVQETSRYVFRIIAYKLVMESPKRYGYRFSRKNLWQPVGYTVVEVTGPVASWVDWAKAKGITYAQLREANPWIRSTKLTNAGGKTYKVRIPKHNDLYRSKRTFTVYNKEWVVD
ncbi:MAG: lytic transglycosylase domain-containing protein [Muribaculaceae bacterium]|nr:lytic transglycosylase domain-containing protein [Muribaculaceae bacterium]